jgi:hypothetical protein
VSSAGDPASSSPHAARASSSRRRLERERAVFRFDIVDLDGLGRGTAHTFDDFSSP